MKRNIMQGREKWHMTWHMQWHITWRGWLLVTLCLLVGCAEGEAPLRQVELPPLTPAVLVLNGLGETLSLFDLATDALTNNVMPVGAVPNHLALAPDGRTMLLTASGANRVEVIDLDRLEITQTIDLGPGSNPYAAAIADDRTAYVTEWLADRVTRIDWRTGRVVRRIPVGASPQGLAVYDDLLLVACSGYANDPTFTSPRAVNWSC